MHNVTHTGVTAWKATNTGYNAEQYSAGGMCVCVCVYIVHTLYCMGS